MGIQKLGITIAEQCAKYAKFCGKTSILQTKSAQIPSDFSRLQYIPELKTDVINIKTCIKNFSKNQQKEKISLDVDKSQKKIKLLQLFEKVLDGKNITPENKLPSLQTDFESLKEARAYAKNRAVAALHSEEPYEHLVVIDKKSHKIFGEYKGDGHQVSAGFDQLRFPEGCSVIHGHPASYKIGEKSISTPISFPDFEYIMSKSCEDIIAFNSNGEFSLLMKTPKFKPLDKGQMFFYETEHLCYVYTEIFKSFLEKLPKEFFGITTLKQLMNKINELKESGKYSQELQTQCKQIVKEWRQDIKKNTPKDEYGIGFEQIKQVHKFWLDYADELGVVYKTNYSYL